MNKWAWSALVGAVTLGCSSNAGESANEDDALSGDGDTTGTVTGGVSGDGDLTPGDGDATSTGGVTGDGDITGTGGVTGDGDGTGTGGTTNTECTDTEADEKFSFFVTSLHHIQLLSGNEQGFGGDLRYNGATSGLAGADAICQEMATRVCHGDKTWKAFLSTSTEDAIERIGAGPWYDHGGNLVANDVAGLTAGDRPAGGACDEGTFDELGVFHDGTTDINNDGQSDDDHDTLTGSNAAGRYDGFSCDDWTSTTALNGSGGGGGPVNQGPRIGHMWPANSGQGFIAAHSSGGCAPEVALVQNGPAMNTTVGSAGGYGAFYCFAQ